MHHSDPHLDATTATRVHPVEISITILLVVVTLSWLGIPLWVHLARTLVINPLTMTQHANVRFPHSWERIGRALIVTPELHRVHHSPLRESTMRTTARSFPSGIAGSAHCANRPPQLPMSASADSRLIAGRQSAACCSRRSGTDAVPGTRSARL